MVRYICWHVKIKLGQHQYGCRNFEIMNLNCRTMRWVCWQRSRTYRRSWSTCVCSVMTPTPCPQPANRSSWMWRDSIAIVCGTSHKYVSIYVIHPTFIKQVSFIIHSFPCIISSLNGTFFIYMYIQEQLIFRAIKRCWKLNIPSEISRVVLFLLSAFTPELSEFNRIA